MKIELTTTARKWHRKWSTWLAILSAMSAAGLGAYALMPERVQLLIPDWPLVALGSLSIVSAMLIPVATSIAQPKLKSDA